MAHMAMDSEVRKSLLDRTDAEKAFRPWWDTLEDTLLNTLIALGNTLVVLYLYLCIFAFLTIVSSTVALISEKMCNFE